MTPQELINLRRSIGITQGQLAALIGKSQTTVKRIEASNRMIPLTIELATRAVTAALGQDLSLLTTLAAWDADSLLDLREANEPKMSQTDVAVLLGVTRHTVAHWEGGGTIPTDAQTKLDILAARSTTKEVPS